MFELDYIVSPRKNRKRMLTHIVELDYFAFQMAVKQRIWKRVTRDLDQFKVGDTILCHEVNRKKRIYTGNAVECIIVSVKSGREAGINPLCCEVTIRIRTHVQTGLVSEYAPVSDHKSEL